MNTFFSILISPFVFLYNYLTREKVVVMSMQDRMALREKYDEDIDSMMTSRRKLVNIGKSAESQAEKRKIASQIHYLDQDIKRAQTEINIIMSMMNVQSAHTHHQKILDLARSHLPSQEQITTAAVEAETVIEELKAKIDIPDMNLAMDISDEERDILRELGGDPLTESVPLAENTVSPKSKNTDEVEDAFIMKPSKVPA